MQRRDGVETMSHESHHTRRTRSPGFPMGNRGTLRSTTLLVTAPLCSAMRSAICERWHTLSPAPLPAVRLQVSEQASRHASTWGGVPCEAAKSEAGKP